MCYSLLISTTDERDFTQVEAEGFHFEKVAERDQEIAEVLTYPNQWFIYSVGGGCSCYFRYSHVLEPFEDMFQTPEEYLEMFPTAEPEDEDDVLATRMLYDLFVEIVQSGEKLDLVAWWSDSSKSDLRQRTVNLTEVGRDRFGFFENTRFEFV